MTVSYSPTEETALIRSTTRQFLEEVVPMTRVRDMMLGDGFEMEVWKAMADLGWQGLAISEEHGGAGYGMVELAVVLEEMGRLLTPGPFFASAVLATQAIVNAGTPEQQSALLPRLASGAEIGTLATFEHPRGWDSGGVGAIASPSNGGWVLDGEKRFVLDAAAADLVIVAARTGGGPDGVGLFVVELPQTGVEITPMQELDVTRRQYEVRLDKVKVGKDALLGGSPGWMPILVTLCRASTGLAAEQVGGAQRCLDIAVEHAKNRYQFGRPIGSYQAIKHMCADMLVRVEQARSCALHGAHTFDDFDELPISAALAGAYCSEAYEWVAGQTIQVLGGTGFTWEHDIHLYFKRAKASSLLLGDPLYHRRMLADAIGL